MNEELQEFVEAKEAAEKRIHAEIERLIKKYRIPPSNHIFSELF